MPSTWKGLDLGNIARAGIYTPEDIERWHDNLRYSNTRPSISISDGMSSVRQPVSSYTVYTSAGTADPPSGLPVAVVAGLAVGGVGLLIFFIVLCCACCKHKSGGRVLQGAAPPSSGPALYPVPTGPAGAPPGPATVPPGAYLGPALAPYAVGQHQHAVAPDQPPAYDSERPLLPAGDTKAPLF